MLLKIALKVILFKKNGQSYLKTNKLRTLIKNNILNFS